jgi:hypothetical protein
MSYNLIRKSTLSRVKPLRTTHERREDDIYDYEYRLKSGLDLLDRTTTIASEDRALIKEAEKELAIDEAVSQFTRMTNGLYQCGFCPIFRTREAAIKEHIIEEHTRERITLGEDNTKEEVVKVQKANPKITLFYSFLHRTNLESICSIRSIVHLITVTIR